MVVLRALCALVVLLLISPAAVAALVPVRDQHDVVLRFEPGSTPDEQAGALRAVGASGPRAVAGLPGVRVATVPSGQSVSVAASRLQREAAVRWAEPVGTRHAVAAPNDPLFDQLWAMAGAGADASVLAAWDMVTGSHDVSVAIVDTGVAPDHPDLAGNVRAADGRNFVAAAGSPVDPADWADQDGHGTHVAGTVGAVGNNGLGVSGINWATGLVPVRVLNLAGSGADSEIAPGIAYAADHARVVNMSFGGKDGGAVLGDAIASHPNTLFVAAAGNTSDNVDVTPFYPCSFPYANLICVAATSQAGGLSSFSDYGSTSVDLGAPGSGILSTTQQFLQVFSNPLLDDAGWTEPTPPGNAWHKVSTSTAGYKAWNLAGSLTGTSDWDIQTPPLPEFAGTACRVTFSLDVALVPTKHAFSVLASSDGTTWTSVFDPVAGTTNGFEQFAASLKKYDGRTGVRLRFRVRGVTATYGGAIAPYATIADPVVSCVVPEPAAGTYGVMSGTSMAAPAVAGAAALLLSYNPRLTVAQLRQALLSTVTPVSGLSGVTVTGGRLNIAAALASIGGEAPTAPAPVAPAVSPAIPMRLTLRGRTPVRLRTSGWTMRVPLRCSGTEASQCAYRLSVSYGVRLIGALNVTVPRGWSGFRVIRINAVGQRVLMQRLSIGATLRAVPRNRAAGERVSGLMRITLG